MWATLSGLLRAPLPVISVLGLRWASADSIPATLWPRAEILNGVAVAAVLNGAVGVGSATTAVVSTRNAPRTSARIGAYRFASLAEAPTLFELGLFSPARASLASKISHLETRRVAAWPFLRLAQPRVFSDGIPSQSLSNQYRDEAPRFATLARESPGWLRCAKTR
jgi:hypothetical protein